MQKLVLAGLLLSLLAGCGGSDDDGPAPLWTATPLASSSVNSGTLQGGDRLLPDGTFADLYSVTLSCQTTLTLRLESTAFDAYLYLFDAAVLGIRDLNAWAPYLIMESDDVYGTDAEIVMTLLPGTYAIVANSFSAGESGPYTLTLSLPGTLAPSARYLQYRTYETPANNRYQGWYEFRDGGALIQAGDILSLSLSDPGGMELLPVAPPSFISLNYTIARWDPGLDDFVDVAASGHSGFAFDFSNLGDPDFPAGTYLYSAQAPAGGCFDTPVGFPGKTVLPFVAASSMTPTWNPDGSLTLSWTEPAGAFDQYRVVLSTLAGEDLFFGRALPGTSSVTLSAALVDTVTANAGLATPTQLTWQMQTRNVDASNNNDARGYSDPLTIDWPAP